ncbi:MAG: DUF4332 domain-containing protein, partial [Pseudomonadota bacterium]
GEVAMSYCRCCGRQLATVEAAHVGQTTVSRGTSHGFTSGLTNDGHALPSNNLGGAPRNTEQHQREAQKSSSTRHPQTAIGPAGAQVAVAQLRWDAHLTEIFEQCERLKGETGGPETELQLAHVAYAMSRMISVAPFLEDAGIAAADLRRSLQQVLAGRSSSPSAAQVMNGGRISDLVEAMRADAIASGAHKISIPHLIRAFGAIGRPLRELSKQVARRDDQIASNHITVSRDHDRTQSDGFKDRKLKHHSEQSQTDTVAWSASLEDGERRDRRTPTRPTGGQRRLFRDPRQLSFRGLTPQHRRGRASTHQAADSTCRELRRDVSHLHETTGRIGDVLSRLERGLADMDRRLARLEASSTAHVREIHAVQRAETRQTTSRGASTSARDTGDHSSAQADRYAERQQSTSSSSSRTYSGLRRRSGAPRRTGFSWLGLSVGRSPGRWLSRSLRSRSRSWERRGRSPRANRTPRDTHQRTRAPETDRGKRFYLALNDDVVDAPSIGPKTADRLRPVGIKTVRDLLDADPEAVARATNVRHITPALVSDWQTQSRLVITIPWMRGTHAQLLVGAGFDTAQSIAQTSDNDVMAAILRFAATREGQRILRDGPPPAREKITGWVENSRQAEPQRAA